MNPCGPFLPPGRKTQTVARRIYRWTKIVSAVFLLFCLSVFVLQSWHWPLIGDAALMHYLVFLMQHGMAPYRDILDPNLPTTLMIESAFVQLFGGGALAWRLFDLFLLGITGISMIVLARPYDWFAGFLAAALFALIHGRDGTMLLGERDLTMTAFLVTAYAFLFAATRALPQPNGIWWKMILFGFFCGAAATIKPTVLLLPFVLLAVAAIILKPQRGVLSRLTLFGLLGLTISIVLSTVWVWRKHAMHAFLATLFDLIPYFARLGTRSFGHLFAHSISAVLLPFVAIWLIVILLRGQQLTWERAALLIGVAFGLGSFYLQRKGYSYHRYPSEAFLLLLASIDLTSVFDQATGSSRLALQRLALAGILVGVFVVGGGSTLHALRLDWRNHEFDTLLQADLTRLGGADLDHRVQCLDMSDACVTTLYNLRLVQATGFLYDCYLFSAVHAPEQDRYRKAFWQAMQRNPPAVFVVSSNDCEVYPDKPSYHYGKISRWPQLDAYMEENYHLASDRIPSHLIYTGSSPSKPLGYRIYLRNEFPQGR